MRIVITLNFQDKEVIFIVFYVKYVNKAVPLPIIETCFWEISLTKKDTH